ncbi:hypothetical protein EVA_05603 [gut metagenome]|uniref:Uncharacterized protein n=1 Tax=gut metagenome TaxID=749906 RepID=J9GU33_9ZZZZ
MPFQDQKSAIQPPDLPIPVIQDPLVALHNHSVHSHFQLRCIASQKELLYGKKFFSLSVIIIYFNQVGLNYHLQSYVCLSNCAKLLNNRQNYNFFDDYYQYLLRFEQEMDRCVAQNANC